MFGYLPYNNRRTTVQQPYINEDYFLVRAKEGRRKSEGRALKEDEKSIGGG